MWRREPTTPVDREQGKFGNWEELAANGWSKSSQTVAVPTRETVALRLNKEGMDQANTTKT